MTPSGAPPLRDIVLLGGGHAHVQVLKRFGMRPTPGLRLTIVSREPHSPYSGMLPGLVAGDYGWEDVHIDLLRLAAFAKARFIAAEATGLDLGNRRVRFDDRPPLRYDVLSLNTGGAPGGAFASDFVTPVKPIGRFLPAWQRIVADAEAQRLAIVGAGAGGVELALAIVKRHPRMTCVLVDAAADILAPFPAAMRRRLRHELARRGVAVETGFQVAEAAGGRLRAADGRAVGADHALWVTGVEAPRWPAESGLEVDAGGFVSVKGTLQSTSHADVFAAGDVAAFASRPLPKSGVYAVRQGPALARNLRSFALGRPLRLYRPQRKALAILGVGGGRAVASRGRLSAAGGWAWRWKIWLDRRFMRRFNELPAMTTAESALAPALRADAPPAMRCGGCGAKLGADALRRALERLAVPASSATLRGIGDDAAIVRPGGADLALSCDGFRAMIDDPYRFGRISAHHALNDLYAMGARPTFALALATIPTMADAMVEDELFQLMSGALRVLREHGVDLVGGHSAEGAELGIALNVIGAMEGPSLAKSGLEPGQALVLTKPLGAGALLAAAKQGRAAARHLLGAVNAMDASSAAAARVLREHGATACTDVTGFGLAGHLTEMTRASGVGARLRLDAIPALPGALDAIAGGIVSSLQNNNEQALADFAIQGAPPDAPAVRLLADPQTAGGLLAGVPPDNADACVQALGAEGCRAASRIGTVVELASGLALSGANA